MSDFDKGKIREIKLSELEKRIERGNKKSSGQPFFEEQKQRENELVESISAHKEDILSLYTELKRPLGEEDRIYRFYHRSEKTYELQYHTEKIVQLFLKLMQPRGKSLNKQFLAIIKEGTNKEFDKSHMENWNNETRPIVEAYFHSKHLLDMIIKFGLNGTEQDRKGNPGWFTVLYLYNIR